MKQVLVIHGGTTFSTHGAYLANLKSKPLDYQRLLAGSDWKGALAAELPNYDILLPAMPNKQNAQYDEWVIMFEKILPLLEPKAILIGHSLGAIFLAKYFQENPLVEPFKKLILIAPPYDDESGEELTDFKLTSTVDLPASARELHFFFSKDDPVVPFSELAKFEHDLPKAKYHIFSDRLHFWQETFPELIDVIRH